MHIYPLSSWQFALPRIRNYCVSEDWVCGKVKMGGRGEDEEGEVGYNYGGLLVWTPYVRVDTFYGPEAL